MLPILIVVTIAAAITQFGSAAPVPLVASAAAAVLGVVLAFALVWVERERPGPRALIAAVLILVNLVLVMRAVITPR
jgi:hypothetical protein